MLPVYACHADDCCFRRLFLLRHAAAAAMLCHTPLLPVADAATGAAAIMLFAAALFA